MWVLWILGGQIHMAEYVEKYGNNTRNAHFLQYLSCFSIPEALQEMIHEDEGVLQGNSQSVSVSLCNTGKRNFNTP